MRESCSRLSSVRVAMVCVAALLSLVTTNCPGQTPTVQVFFDNNLSQWNKWCPGFVFDSLFVVADHFPESLLQIEYSISYSPEVAWLGDTGMAGTTTGSTPTGITHIWGFPGHAADQFVLAVPLIMWMCDDCSVGGHICPKAHPNSGYIRALGAEHEQWIFAEGLGANVCPPMCGDGPCGPYLCEAIPSVPVEATTWGAVKELYR